MNETIVKELKKCKIKRVSAYKEYDYIEGEIVKYDTYYISNIDNSEAEIMLKVLNFPGYSLLKSADYYNIVISDITSRQFYKLNYSVKIFNDCGIVQSFECENIIMESVDYEPDFSGFVFDSEINEIEKLSNVYTYVKKIEVGYNEIHNVNNLVIVLTKDDNMILDDDIVIIAKSFEIEDFDDLFSVCSHGALRIFTQLDTPKYKYCIKNEWRDDMYENFTILFNDIKIFTYDGNSVVPYLVITDSDSDYKFKERYSYYHGEINNILSYRIFGSH